MRVFPDEISIWIGGLLEQLPSPVWVGITQSTEGLTRTKGRRRPHCLGCDVSSHLLLPLDWDLHHGLPWSSGLQTQTELHLGLQLAGGRSWNFSASITM